MPNITRLTVFRWRFVLPRSRSLSEGTRSYGRLVTIYQSALLFSLLEAEEGDTTPFRNVFDYVQVKAE